MRGREQPHLCLNWSDAGSTCLAPSFARFIPIFFFPKSDSGHVEIDMIENPSTSFAWVHASNQRPRRDEPSQAPTSPNDCQLLKCFHAPEWKARQLSGGYGIKSKTNSNKAAFVAWCDWNCPHLGNHLHCPFLESHTQVTIWFLIPFAPQLPSRVCSCLFSFHLVPWPGQSFIYTQVLVEGIWGCSFQVCAVRRRGQLINNSEGALIHAKWRRNELQSKSRQHRIELWQDSCVLINYAKYSVGLKSE